MNALADPELGEYLNQHFVSAFQKVGTFKIVGDQKQGGNVASYFCAQDGRVLHVVAGPVNASTLLKEARWVVETSRKLIADAAKSGKSFKAQFRRAHAERLRQGYGLTVEPVVFDTPSAGESSSLTYRDPNGNTLAPVLPPPPIEGPDVGFGEARQAEFSARHKPGQDSTSGVQFVQDRCGMRWRLDNQGRVHTLLAAHCMKNIETVYGSIFEGILGEKVSTKPVIVASPFPWIRRAAANKSLIKINQGALRGTIQ